MHARELGSVRYVANGFVNALEREGIDELGDLEERSGSSIAGPIPAHTIKIQVQREYEFMRYDLEYRIVGFGFPVLNVVLDRGGNDGDATISVVCSEHIHGYRKIPDIGQDRFGNYVYTKNIPGTNFSEAVNELEKLGDII
jgi:hypothetical protein